MKIKKEDLTIKVSIFYKFFAIIFLTFLAFEFINIRVDYKGQTRIHLNKITEEPTIIEERNIFNNKDEVYDFLNQQNPHQDQCIHFLVTETIYYDGERTHSTTIDQLYVPSFKKNREQTLKQYISKQPTASPTSDCFIELSILGQSIYYDLSHLTYQNLSDIGNDYNGSSLGKTLEYHVVDGKVVYFNLFGFKKGTPSENYQDIRHLSITQMKTPYYEYQGGGFYKNALYNITGIDHQEIIDFCVDYYTNRFENNGNYGAYQTQHIPYNNGYIVMQRNPLWNVTIENDTNEHTTCYEVICNYKDALMLENEVNYQINHEKLPLYVLLLFLSIIASYVLSKMLTRHIKDISEATTKITNFDFDVHLPEYSNDEIGTLSANINIMSSRLKEMTDDLNHEIEMVKHLEGLRKEFIANFTHEIKTPIAIINGYIELLDKTDDEHKKSEYLEAINKETNHITKLVMAMLDLSQLEAGKKDLSLEVIDLEEVLTEILDSYLPLIKKKEIMIEMDLDESIFMADLKEIKKVFRNLLSNAIKHTPSKGTIYILFKDNQLSIENEGEPLSAVQINQVFETYVSSDREGTGLGLAICKAIFELHQFDYGVENTNKGVKFYFQTNGGAL